MLASKCLIINCGAPEKARGLCRKHYKRWQRHGHTEQTRPADWGRLQEHPGLRAIWKRLKRVYETEMDLRWRDDFWEFQKDIGEKPEGCQFCRINDLKPWGRENWYWRPSVKTPEKKLKASLYQRSRRQRLKEANPEYFQDADLRKQYGVTLEWFNQTLESQNHGCAICGSPETLEIRGKLVRLAVDHKPGTRHVRGLLCSKCNRGLGLFCDNSEILKLAAKYLESHEKRLRKLLSE